MIRRMLCLAAALTVIPAQFAVAVDKWQEAVIVAADGEAWQRFFVDIAGWEQRHCKDLGSDEAEVIDALSPPASECLYANAGDDRGWVRVLTAPQPALPTARFGTMPWDTGGIFSLMFYGEDVKALYASAERWGWDALAPPIPLSAGPSRLLNVVLRGPDGVNVSVYQRLSPPLTEFPNVRYISSAFNAMFMVRDMPAMKSFVREVLAFEEVAAGDFVDRNPGPNNFGLPHNWADNLIRRFSIWGPGKDLDGRVELLQFIGLTGQALRPGEAFHRGILALRFPVDNLDRELERIAYKPMAAPRTVALEPYGQVRIATFLSPEGGRFELMERR